MVLGADGLAAEGAGESLPLVQSLVVRQGFRLEEAQVTFLALGAHLQVRVWRRRKTFLPTGESAVNNLQRCGSGMFIPDHDFCPSRIPNLGYKNSNKKEGRNIFLLSYLFCSHKYHKNLKLFYF